MQEQTDYYLHRQIGNYRLVRRLGGGAFGSVYQGQHVIFNDNVAIKILHANLHSAQERERFFSEARILKTLQHPNTLHILDAGLYEGVCYIVMDYAPGGSLRDRLDARNGQLLPQPEGIQILEQVGEALHDAHQHNIVHRDLKPDNILFDAEGNALLADFGIAVLREKTSSVDVVGTPPYMAPEQFQGKISPRSDQYSLAIIAYELLTAHRPFVAPSGDMFAWGWMHHSEAPTPPTQYNAQLPSYIEQAILKALTKNREQRYANVELFVRAMREPEKTKEQWLEEGNKHYKAQQYDEALAAYDQALRLDPNYVDAYLNKGTTLYSLKRYDEALTAYDHAIRLNPSYAVAYYNKGLTLDDLERDDEALTAFDHAIRLDSSYADAYYFKGVTLYNLERDDEALAAYNKYIQLAPDDVDGYTAKARTLQSLGREREAQQMFAKARELGWQG